MENVIIFYLHNKTNLKIKYSCLRLEFDLILSLTKQESAYYWAYSL